MSARTLAGWDTPDIPRDMAGRGSGNRHVYDVVRGLERQQVVRRANVSAQIDSLSVVQDAMASVVNNIQSALSVSDDGLDGVCGSDSGRLVESSADLKSLEQHLRRQRSLLNEWRTQIDNVRDMVATCLRREVHANQDVALTTLRLLSLRRRAHAGDGTSSMPMRRRPRW